MSAVTDWVAVALSAVAVVVSLVTRVGVDRLNVEARISKLEASNQGISEALGEIRRDLREVRDWLRSKL